MSFRAAPRRMARVTSEPALAASKSVKSMKLLGALPFTCNIASPVFKPACPAGQAGLKTGDAILQVNGKAPRSFIDFTDLLAARAGSEVTLAIRRGLARSEKDERLSLL